MGERTSFSLAPGTIPTESRVHVDSVTVESLRHCGKRQKCAGILFKKKNSVRLKFLQPPWNSVLLVSLAAPVQKSRSRGCHCFSLFLELMDGTGGESVANRSVNCLGTVESCDVESCDSASENKSDNMRCILLCCSLNSSEKKEAHTPCLLQSVQEDERDGPPVCPWCQGVLECHHSAWQEHCEGLLVATEEGRYNFLRAHSPAAVEQYVSGLRRRLTKYRNQLTELSQRYDLLYNEWSTSSPIFALPFVMMR